MIKEKSNHHHLVPGELYRWQTYNLSENKPLIVYVKEIIEERPYLYGKESYDENIGIFLFLTGYLNDPWTRPDKISREIVVDYDRLKTTFIKISQ